MSQRTRKIIQRTRKLFNVREKIIRIRQYDASGFSGLNGVDVASHVILLMMARSDIVKSLFSWAHLGPDIESIKLKPRSARIL